MNNKDIEIIVVNDGTKDNSQKIIDKYVKKYKNVKSYIKENGGLSSARNYGIKKAKGEYIAFVDSDDYVELDTYERLYNKAKTNDFDMVVCNLNYVYDDHIEKASSNLYKDVFSIDEKKEAMLNIYPAAWNKIYKSNLLQTQPTTLMHILLLKHVRPIMPLFGMKMLNLCIDYCLMLIVLEQ